MSNYEQPDLFQTPKESTSLPALTLVNRFPLQARKGAKKIRATSGQKFIDSLEMTGFVQCTFLEKTLVDILDKVSTPYQRTWSVVVTDGGVSVLKQRVSGRITKDKESGGSQKMWSTPIAQEIEHPNAELTHTGRRKTKDGKSSHSLGLTDQARMWPTPRVKGEEKLETLIKRKGIKKAVQHNLHAAVEMWPTPSANEDAAGQPGAKMQKMLGNHPEVRGEGIGTLNPTWVEWLMGFPTGYTVLKHSETQ